MAEDSAGEKRARQDEAAAPAADGLGQRGATRGATAEELKGISAVPTEGDEHGKGGGAHAKPGPDDEVDPGVG